MLVTAVSSSNGDSRCLRTKWTPLTQAACVSPGDRNVWRTYLGIEWKSSENPNMTTNGAFEDREGALDRWAHVSWAFWWEGSQQGGLISCLTGCYSHIQTYILSDSDFWTDFWTQDLASQASVCFIWKVIAANFWFSFQRQILSLKLITIIFYCTLITYIHLHTSIKQ